MLNRLRFALTIFVGAFLLFQIQPLIARFILPWFGGGAAVWATCLVFFQLILVAGYAYAFALARYLSPRRQAVVHLALLLASLLFLPITPGAGWKPSDAGDPTWRILALLVANIGLPCLMISSTAPLLQSWFGRLQSTSPYRLYALSNLGSLLGLLTYPFLFEPLLGAHSQTSFWSVGHGVFVAACAWCAVGILVSAPPRPAEDVDATTSETDWVTWTFWLSLPAFGVVLLLATTNELTTNIAPFPFLWVVPLALYLVSYIVCFAGDRFYQRRLWVSGYALLLLPTLWLSFIWRSIGLLPFITLWSATLLAGCMICHGELARRKPAPADLTRFYLAVAVGGACGGVFVALLAPLVFTRFWEVQLGLIGTFFLAGATMKLRPTKEQTGTLAVWGVAAAIFLGLTALPIRAERDYIASVRNFYGRVSVSESRRDGEVVREMFHGRINHGVQLVAPKRRREPTLYYHMGSGVAMAIGYQQRRDSLRIGVIGLGIGTLATYGRAKDSIRFYELNPAVHRLARRYFTFLDDSPAKIDVILGDGRISLERELRERGSQGFDLLVLDAFTSESIPIHLLTKEAFALYMRHLSAVGLLVVHISNTYLDLSSVVRNHARAHDKTAVLLRHRFAKRQRAEADWVIITGDQALLTQLRPHTTPWPTERTDIRWTDDHSNLFGVLK